MEARLLDDPVRRSYLALHRYASAPSPDEVFLDDMQARIDAARSTPAADARAPTDARAPRILLLGYGGAGNTGADLRTIETVAQLRRLFAPRIPAITLFALGGCFDHPMLVQTPKLEASPPYVPDAIDAAIRDADIVLNVEGSTYTSKFSDSLAGILVGGIALARAHRVPAIAYGVDSGAMSDALTCFVRRNATDPGRVICRNEAACAQLDGLGVASAAGADTAWTWCAPRRPQADDTTRVAALCPGNPFWWPVRADAARARSLDARGEASPHRYGPLHFHSWDAQRASAYDAYLDRFASIANGLRTRGYTPVLVGMERIDLAACEDLAARLPFEVERVVRGERPLETVASAVAHARCVVTTRYHAAVLAISHSVPVFGLSMDARIDRLFSEAGCGQWVAACDADDAAQMCADAIDTLRDPQVRDALKTTQRNYARQQRERFEAMGAQLLAAVGGIP